MPWSAGPLSRPSFERFASSIVLTEVVRDYVDGCVGWLFAVDYGDGTKVAVSAALGDNQLGILTLDPTVSHSTGPLSWTNLTDAFGLELAGDHWHVYAHHRHWISFATGSQFSQYLWLAEIEQIGDDDFSLIRLLDVVKGMTSDSGPTNDHWMVDMANGVAVAVFASTGAGSRWLHILNRGVSADSDTEISGNVDPALSHSNGGSAIREPFDGGVAPGEIHIFAPSTLSPQYASVIHHFVTDATLEPSATSVYAPDIEEGFDTDGDGVVDAFANLTMPTAVRFDNGHYLVTYRRIYPLRASGDYNDNGDIVREMFDASGAVVDRVDGSGAPIPHPEYLTTGETCNNPHSMRFGNYLITCWTDNSVSHCVLLCEEING